MAAKQERSLSANILWLALATGITKPLWFLFITAACMRVLGPTDYGYLTAVLALAFVSASFVDLGAGRYTVRELVRKPQEGVQVVSGLLTLRVVLSVISILVCVAAAFALGYRGWRLLGALAASLYVVLMLATSYYRSIYQAFGDLRTEAVTHVTEKVLVVLVGGIALVSFRGPAPTLFGMAAGMCAGMVIAQFIVRLKFVKATVSTQQLDRVRPLLSSIFVIGLASLFTVVYLRTDQIMIQSMIGDTAAGLYGASFRIIEAFIVIPTIIAGSALYPRLVRLRSSRDEAKYRTTLRNGVLTLAGIGLASCAGVVLLADFGLRLLAGGPEFAGAVPSLQILSVTLPMLFVNNLLYSALMGFDDERWLAACLFLVAVLNVAGNAMLLPRIGIVGAALATVGSELVLLIAYALRLSPRLSDIAARQ